MVILGENLTTGFAEYINVNHYTRFTVTEDRVEVWSPDNLTIELKKTKALKEQLDALLVNHTSKGLEKFS